MFSPNERTAIFSLASIFAFRMLGLFIIIPVFSPYLQTLPESTPFLIGLTMGIYGLTQACLQIPFGILSDYIGRKEVITLGLIIFLIGSLVAASSSNIWLVMLGRALQGAGAISGTAIALLSDLTSEESRTKAMAIVGVSIGFSFMLAFMLGPLLHSFISVNKIFYLIAVLVIPILFILWRITPNPENKISYSKETSIKNIFLLFKNKKIFKQLKIHSFGIFSLHGILMANFVAVPILLKNQGLTSFDQSMSYIGVFIVSVLAMAPLVIISEKKKKQKMIMIISVLLLIAAEIVFWLANNTFWGIIAGLTLFFTGFNVLEASLPSLISKLSPKDSKGTAMGLYSSAQFLGPMIGGAISGVLFKYYGLVSIFLFGFLWAILWFIALRSMPKDIDYKSNNIINNEQTI